MGQRIFLLLAALVLPVLLAGAGGAGCGGTIIEASPDGGEGGGGGIFGVGHTTGVGPGGADAGGKDALPDYVDPGCPDAGPPLTDFQCDPYTQLVGECGPGQACYIYVAYPSEPCGQETYGALCAEAGPGSQGDACNGGPDCGAGFVCVVSGSGNQCVELCKLTGESGCAAGLVCEPIDVEGFGGCL